MAEQETKQILEDKDVLLNERHQKLLEVQTTLEKSYFGKIQDYSTQPIQVINNTQQKTTLQISEPLTTDGNNFQTDQQDQYNRQLSLVEKKQQITDLYKVKLEVFLATNSTLSFPQYSSPKTSIIIILYNRAELTYQCLKSLNELVLTNDFSFEIIIVDNASSDRTDELLAKVEGVKIIRNDCNLNYLLAVNQAATVATGEYLLLLNNDAQILAGSLTSAIKTIESGDDIGAVGGKIILLDGSLQEAGSIIWQDGSCLGYGRGDSPFAPEYMFQRDVDYCSGAFLLTPRELFLQLGGFDTDYCPAYYEETDYCLKLWKMGKRVVYDPNAIILHFEFASSQSSEQAIALQTRNRQIFQEKHSLQLQSHSPCSELNILVARNASQKKRILFIDDRVPHCTLGSGYPRANEILLTLLELGYFVTFYPLMFPQESWSNVYEDIPNTVEVMINHGSDKLEKFLETRQSYYDVIFVSRPHNMRSLKPILEHHPDWFSQTKIIYDAEALFSLREIMQRKLQGIDVSSDEIDNLVEDELTLARGVDSIISVSQQEQETFIKYGFNTTYILGHSLKVTPTSATFAERSHILFVGPIEDIDEDYDTPNTDAIFWFITQVLPIIRTHSQCQDVELLLVGKFNSEKIRKVADEKVKICSKVKDLTPYFNKARLFIAPTRFAAGIPHKVHCAAAHGLPIVCSSLIGTQVGWQDSQDFLVADTPWDYAQKCLDLYTDEALWQKLRHNALQRVKEDCSSEHFREQLKLVLDNLINLEK